MRVHIQDRPCQPPLLCAGVLWTKCALISHNALNEKNVLESQLPHKIVDWLFSLVIVHQLDDFVGELTFENILINTFCEIRWSHDFVPRRARHRIFTEAGVSAELASAYDGRPKTLQGLDNAPRRSRHTILPPTCFSTHSKMVCAHEDR